MEIVDDEYSLVMYAQRVKAQAMALTLKLNHASHVQGALSWHPTNSLPDDCILSLVSIRQS